MRKRCVTLRHVETGAYNFAGYVGRHRQAGSNLISAPLAAVLQFCPWKGWLADASSSRSARLWRIVTQCLPFRSEMAGT